MMRKYGVENINEHFISFNTICDATQVSPFIHIFSFLVILFVIRFFSSYII